MSDQRGVLSEGFRRMWHYQRVLWFVFVINLVFSHFGSGAAIHKLDWVTDHSLESRRVAEMFDYGAFSALSSNPEVRLFEVAGVSISFSIVFFIVVLFLTGGILEAYRADRRLTTREFFEACGTYFWRWVRLVIMMAIVLIPILILASVISKQGTSPMLSAATEKTGFWILVGGYAVCGLLMMIVRLWFDMAQVRAVVEEEPGMWRNAGQAFKLTFGNFGSLFWIYFRISLVGWSALVAGLYIWSQMPPARFGWTLFFLEIVVLAGFATRFWQRSSEMVWYQRHFLVPAVAPAPIVPAPVPLVTITPPSTTPGPEN